ncbi:response regulator [Paenibacillus sp. HJL G12]|uniref:Response regulator n=1 Tax=Paenibacillus dendrobii TaxID=2691084 RepID=A0A7X3ILV2_9BACL|nr:response regulator [Paenibacillus dendrobii]MWV46353.1 response regulator [Paenibacillus dendrobii]
MRAILVDDERLALELLQQMLEKKVGGVTVVGAYTNPVQALEEARELQPDLIFLDIHMPGIDGLKLGDLLQESIPSLKIVFVTGYDRYAVEAFEMNALDYILKPPNPKRLQKTLERFRESENKRMEADTGQALLCCFNQLQYQPAGEPPQPLKWRTGKAQELFAFMLHHRGRIVDKETLLEMLWPEYDTPRALQYLYTTVYHIRQTLKNNGLDHITISSGSFETGYRLTFGDLRLDTEEWKTQVLKLGPLNVINASNYELTLDMYKGDYLAEYDYVWAEPEREHLRGLWLRTARSLSAFYELHQLTGEAVRLNLRVQQLFPYDEECCLTLMKLYREIGDKEGVQEQYRLLAARIEGELGSSISGKVQDWYTEWDSARS